MKMADPYVLTPGGYKPAANVHHIPPGHLVKMAGDTAELHHAQTGLVRILGITPQHQGGPLMPAHILSRPPGAPAPAARPGPAVVGAPAPFAQTNGWVSYTGWTNGTVSPIASLSTAWIVPPEPTNRGSQTVFLFNGIQNATMIYQPVLQWGPSAAGGGQKWSVACWYADSQTGHSFYSTLIDVAVGAHLTGVMTMTGNNGGLFDYSAEFVGIANTQLPIAQVQELTWANETLEAYQISSRNDFPATAFTDLTAIDLRTVQGAPANFLWDQRSDHPETGSSVTVVNGAAHNGTVRIKYQP
jgi:hypothetical protein